MKSKRPKQLFTLLLIIVQISLITKNSLSQKGTISGLVFDKTRNETLTGANVVIQGTNVGTITDFDGKFTLDNLNTGIYNLMVSFISYNTVIVEGVKVEENKISSIKVEIEEISTALEGVTVTATRKVGTEISMISAIKASPIIASGVSAQQISRSQDRDASEVIRRIPGITIIDERFVVIRGLSQRYNNVWLNNSATPSSEADVKAFSFDVIPSSIIESLTSYKSPSPELPADFAGGFIKVSTKGMPDKSSINIGFSQSITQNTTFNKFYMYRGGKTDWLGFDDGTRALPKEMPDNLNIYESAQNPIIQEKVTDLGRALNANWKLFSSSTSPDTRISLAVDNKFGFGKKSLGNITFLSYSNTQSHNDILIYNYSIYDFVNNRSQFTDRINDDQYTRTAKINLLHNWSYFMGKGHKVEFRNLFNQIGWSRTTIRNGIDGYNDNRIYRSYELRYLSRTTYSGQLGGEHSFKEGDAVLDWNIGYAYANKKEPDLKRYRLLRNISDTTQYFMVFTSGSPDLSSEARYWLDMNEKNWSGGLNFNKKLTWGNIKPSVKTGIYFENKNREFNARNFGYTQASSSSTFSTTTLPVDHVFAIDNINRTTGIKLMEITDKSDSYRAANDQLAAYLVFDIPIISKLKLFAGLRVEKNRQTLSSYQHSSTIKVNVTRDTINLFPSANITYNINEKNLIRFAYGISVNRPEFREIAPFYFVDFELNAGVEGNPEIKQSYIHNYEVRYENYPTPGENFSISAFYKNFIDPIELIIIGNNPLQYTFDNVKTANAYGIETDIRKSLDFIEPLKNFSITVNAAFINSRVNFNNGTLYRDRSLQGQSPFIINSGIFYQNDKGLMFSILYNVVGDRITAVGRSSPNKWEDIPNIYEKARHMVDLSFSKEIGKHIEIKAGVKNMLNSAIVYRQTIDTDTDLSYYTGDTESNIKHFKRQQVTKSYRPGSYFTLGVSLKI